MARVQPEPRPGIEQQPQRRVETKPELLPKPETAAIKSPSKVSRQRPVKPRSRPDRHPKTQPAIEAIEPQPKPVVAANPVKPTPAEAVQAPLTAVAPPPASASTVEPQQPQATRLLIIDWLQEELKQHFSYPRQARRRGWQGTVMLEFTVASRGGITDIRISQSSGHGLLDRNAEETLQRIASSGMTSMPFVGQTMSLAVPVSYRLR
ncbi:MAG: TonB family protein [Sedimenticola sp.]|nr:TonB family protein [Sedimenticola sp.]